MLMVTHGFFHGFVIGCPQTQWASQGSVPHESMSTLDTGRAHMENRGTPKKAHHIL